MHPIKNINYHLLILIINVSCALCTVWDRVPKEDAANFESATFLWFVYIVNMSKIAKFSGRFWIFG